MNPPNGNRFSPGNLSLQLEEETVMGKPWCERLKDFMTNTLLERHGVKAILHDASTKQLKPDLELH